MKPYQHAQAILDGKPMLAVLIAAAEILAERNQLDIALEGDKFSEFKTIL